MLRLWVMLSVLWASSAWGELRYSGVELNRVLLQAGPNLRKVLYEDIAGKLPPEQAARVSKMRLVFPETGPSPMSFFARLDRNEIHMPLTSIRFFDDIATLYAWFNSKNCRPEYIQTYVYSVLRSKTSLPVPLEAFGLARKTLFADAFTEEASAKVYSSALQFILAHEVAHLLLDHGPTDNAAVSQTQEAEADAFAFDHFARLGGSPGGIFWYFFTALWFDSDTEADQKRATHPMTSQRTRAMADLFLTRPMDFAHGEDDPDQEAAIIRDMGGMLSTLSGMMQDADLRDFMVQTVLRDFPLSDLKRACPG